MKQNTFLLLCGVGIFFGLIQEGTINASQPEEVNQERRIVPRVENDRARGAVPNNEERRIVPVQDNDERRIVSPTTEMLRDPKIERDFFELIQSHK